MEILESYNKLTEKQFQREVGIKREKFNYILELVTTHIKEQKQEKPIRQRGLKNGMSIANRLLLALLYMRHYMTFSQLSIAFDISEGYANKLYHQIAPILPKVLEMPKGKELLNPKTYETIAIDAAEQPIERPQSRQKLFYSGKKNSTPSKHK